MYAAVYENHFWPQQCLLHSIQCQQFFQLRMTKMKTVSPQASASYISLLFFSWLDPLVWTGWKRPLRQQDLPAVSPEVILITLKKMNSCDDSLWCKCCLRCCQLRSRWKWRRTHECFCRGRSGNRTRVALSLSGDFSFPALDWLIFRSPFSKILTSPH